MAKLFFSYSHKDEVLRDELQTHLEMLKHSGAIETWHDRMIPAGGEFDGAIKKEMEQADVILLLVSSDFLASRYCFDVEVQTAMERHTWESARVIPVILRPCDWLHAPFAKILAAPTDGKPITMWPNRDEAFLNVVKAIRAALPAVTKPVVPAALPSASSFPDALPRSSNLRVKKEFTEADQDAFMDEAFDYMSRFFHGSLVELENRYPDIKTKFKQIDAHCFTSVIYQKGAAVSRCSIRQGSARSFGGGITYSHDDNGSRISFNEALNLEVGEHSLSLKLMGMSGMMSGRDRDSHLSFEGAAEAYWAKLIEPLQR